MSNLILEWTQLLVKSFFSIHSVFVAQGDLDLKLVFLNGPHFSSSQINLTQNTSKSFQTTMNPTMKTLL